MSRIHPVNREQAPAATAALLSGVQKKMGMVPNLIATMANSTAVAQAYLGFSTALAGGTLPAELRERIALTVGEYNSCEYCVSAHSFLGSRAGISDEELKQARRGESDDSKIEAALRFAYQIVARQGHITDADLQAIRDAGYSETEIVEIVGNVALNLFTNYVNHVAETEVDFPRAAPLLV